MRESTGNALLMTLMTSVVAIVLSFLVGAISYSKSYRIKNHIIDEIEECQTFADCTADEKDFNGWLEEDPSLKEIEEKEEKNLSVPIGKYLKDVGYKYSNKETCPAASDIYKDSNSTARYCDKRLHGNKEEYNYCVYRCYENGGEDNGNTFYHVITYMQMDFPLVNKVVNFKITGNTKSFYK